MPETAADTRLPVHVLTGFLGSGKTTLLRHLLGDPALADTAVLINEAGEVGLDHLLVGMVEGAPLLLENGCVCCTLRGDLAEALRRLLEDRRAGRVPPFARVVVETSGLSDPTPVLATLTGDLVLRRALRPGRVVATIDAVLGAAALDAQPLSRKQAAVADTLVLTKPDLAGAAAVAGLAGRLRALNPAALVHEATHGAVPAEALFGPATAVRDWQALATMPVAADATAFTLRLDRPVGFGAFALWFSLLVHCHAPRLLRVKALLDVEGSAAPVVLHAVQHLIHPPEHLPAWPFARGSALVFVTDGLPRAALARSLAAFTAPGA